MAGLGLWKHPACSDSVLAGTPPNLGGFYPAPALTAKAIFHPNFIFFSPAVVKVCDERPYDSGVCWSGKNDLKMTNDQ